MADVEFSDISGEVLSVASAFTSATRRTNSGGPSRDCVCHLCEETLPLYKVARGVDFCQPCFARVRANHRRLTALVNGKSELADDKHTMINEPDVWRNQPFFASDGQRAQQKALARVAANFNEQVKIEQDLNLSDKESDNDLESAELSDDFDELHGKQEIENVHDMTDSSGRKLVWVHEAPRFRSVRGKQKLEGTRRGGDFGGGGPSASGGGHAARLSRGSSRDGDADNQLSKRARTGKTGGGSAGSHAQSPEEKSDGVRFLEQRQAIMQTLKDLSAQLQGPKAGDAQSRLPSQRPHTRPPTPLTSTLVFSRSSSPNLLYIFPFLAIELFHKGLQKGVKTMQEDIKSRGIDSELLPFSPSSVLEDISTAIADLGKSSDMAQKVKAHEITILNDNIKLIQTKVADAKKKKDDLGEAVDFCVKEVRAKERAQGQKVYWATYTIEKALIKGGFGKMHAKKFSRVIHALEEDGDIVHQYPGPGSDAEKRQSFMVLEIGKPKQELDLDGFGYWPDGHEATKELADSFLQSQVVKDKIANMRDALTKNPSWAGALTNVEGVPFEEGLQDLLGKLPTGPGCEPWLLSGRAHCCRHGPLAFALPGVASLLFAFDKGVHIQISAISPILEKGFTLKEYPKYLESSDGQSYLDSSVWTVYLAPQSFLYLPMGFLVHWVYHSSNAGKESEGEVPTPKAKGKAAKKAAAKKVAKEETPADAAFLLTVPAFTSTTKMEPGVKSAVLGFNAEVIRSKGKDPKWETRGIALESCFKE
ncbi:unnamed protein product [Prorocentrum cordatum]|uniref:Uncharacterized protein n=1 Tax=Prorocentrum cordatum TaxID=2364126 RepID=A0ABN9V8V9_9DINO|nr:unnamed protein product [Polarella glacialis]